ncbi:MAG: flippase, partial [Cystobacter sp.]
ATALSLGICEVIVTLILLGAIGSRAFDARSLGVLGKTVAVCAAVTLVHLLLGHVGLDARNLPRGLARLGVDGALYLLLILATGAVRRDEVLALVRRVRERRKSAPAPSVLPEDRAA